MTVQQFVSAGQTEAALAELLKTKSDAILLQARWNQGKKQYNMGHIDFGEWSRIQAQINYAVLELAGTDSRQTESTSVVIVTGGNSGGGNSVDDVTACLQSQTTYDGAIQCFNRATEDHSKRQRFADGLRAWKDAEGMGRLSASQKMDYMTKAIELAEQILGDAVNEDFDVQDGMLETLSNALDAAEKLSNALAMEAALEKVMRRIELMGTLTQQRFIAAAFNSIAEARTGQSKVRAAKEELVASKEAQSLDADLQSDVFVQQANTLYTNQIRIAINALREGIDLLTNAIISNKMNSRVRK
jgi:tetratricopeptide (TPR) repeat protein